MKWQGFLALSNTPEFMAHLDPLQLLILKSVTHAYYIASSTGKDLGGLVRTYELMRPITDRPPRRKRPSQLWKDGKAYRASNGIRV